MRQFRMTLRAVAVTFEMALRQAAADSFVIFAVLFQPMLIAVLALWMLKDREAGNAIFVVVGSALTGLWSSVLFVCGNSITQERWTGTLETLIGLPTPISVIVFGKNLAFTVQSLLSMVVSYILAAWLFSFPLRVEQPFLFAISIAFMVISFVSLGLLLGCMSLITLNVMFINNTMYFLLLIFSGANLDISTLPTWMQAVSQVLPLTRSIAAARRVIAGDSLANVAPLLAAELLIGIVYITLGYVLFRWFEFQAKRRDTLERI
jgi:ABC-2 type transport system permease protein